MGHNFTPYGSDESTKFLTLMVECLSLMVVMKRIRMSHFDPYGGDEKNENEPHPQNLEKALMVVLNYQI